MATHSATASATALIFTAPLLLAELVPAQVFDARNDAMGGVGVASSRYVNAGIYNPALLTRHKENDSFGITLPTLGAFASDQDQLIDAIDAFQNTLTSIEDQLDQGATVAQSELNTLSGQLLALNGKTAYVNAGGGLALALPSKNLAVSLFVHSYVDARAFVRIDPGDVGVINNVNTTRNFNGLQSEGVVLGAGVTDVGLSLAHEFDLQGPTLSIGITPKFQRVDTFNYAVGVQTFEDSNFDEGQYRNDDNGFNLDLGAALVPVPGVTVGLAARNVVSADYDTMIANGTQFAYQISPRVTAGVALSNDTFTIAADLDVTDVERFKLNDASQSFRIGGEWDAGGHFQLRGGFSHDFENTLDNRFSAGIGISPFDVFHLDLAGSTSGSNTYGATIQLSLTF